MQPAVRASRPVRFSGQVISRLVCKEQGCSLAMLGVLRISKIVFLVKQEVPTPNLVGLMEGPMRTIEGFVEPLGLLIRVMIRFAFFSLVKEEEASGW